MPETTIRLLSTYWDRLKWTPKKGENGEGGLFQNNSRPLAVEAELNPIGNVRRVASYGVVGCRVSLATEVPTLVNLQE